MHACAKLSGAGDKVFSKNTKMRCLEIEHVLFRLFRPNPEVA